jgi:hypothetical protein
LQQWLPLSSSQPNLLYPFFKVNPNTLDSIFAVKAEKKTTVTTVASKNRQ